MSIDRLSVVIDRADGTQARWADDEPDAPNVPTDLSFGTSMPGGFKDFTCGLLRDQKTAGREGLFDTVTVNGPGGQVAWQGRLQQVPMSTESGGQSTPQAVGWSAHLQDDETFRYIYMDRDLSRWSAPTTDRLVNVQNLPFKPFAGSTGYHTQAGATIDVVCDGYAWSSNNGRPHAMVCYDAGGGLTVGRLSGRVNRYGSNVAVGDPAWSFLLQAGDTELVNQGRVSENFTYYTDGQLFIYYPQVASRFVEATAYYTTAPAGSADNARYGYHLYAVNVQGPHGLTEYPGAGVHPDGIPMSGLLASDVIAHALPLSAPLIRFTTGSAGTITPTTFPIGHLIFPDYTTAGDVVAKANAFHVWDWAVWENRTFHFHPPGSGPSRTWVASTAGGLSLSLEGQTTDQIYNGVVVTYTDFAGIPRNVGPPGAAADATDALLMDTNTLNQATARGIARKWGVLPLQSPTTQQGAVAIGQAWLLEQARATRKGSASISGTITDQAGAVHPAWAVRAGDQLVVADRPNEPPRRVIETSYSHSSRTVQMTLDSTAAGLQALFERLAVSLVGQG